MSRSFCEEFIKLYQAPLIFHKLKIANGKNFYGLAFDSVNK
jgi:hypothetical protein